MSTQTEARRLADRLDLYATGDDQQQDTEQAAAELRRLESENESLREQNTAVDQACAKLEAANAELLTTVKDVVAEIEWRAKISGAEGALKKIADQARAAIAKHKPQESTS